MTEVLFRWWHLILISKSWICQLLIIVYHMLREQAKNPMDRFSIYRFLAIPILTDFWEFKPYRYRCQFSFINIIPIPIPIFWKIPIYRYRYTDTDTDYTDYRSIPKCDCMWWYMIVSDGMWWWMMVYDSLWWFMMVYDSLWWWMVVYDGSWRWMMVYEALWW